MSDELTPEEQEALKSLSRERIPSAGLENRVVGAMRERGFLAKQPGRTVRMTGSRVAGLVAACIVLVIGAYSIGLHRGNNEAVIDRITPQAGYQPPATPSETGDMAARKAPAAAQPMVPAEELLADKDQEAPALEWKLKKSEAETTSPLPGVVYKRDEVTASAERAAPPASEPRVDRLNEAAKPADEGILESTGGRSDSPAPAPAAGKLSRQTLSSEVRMQPRSSRTFLIGGSTFVIDAPDSVRIVQEAQGRVLLIYTSDGLIRIRLAD